MTEPSESRQTTDVSDVPDDVGASVPLSRRIGDAPDWAMPFARLVIRRVVIALVLVIAAWWLLDKTAHLVGLILLAFFFSLAMDPGVTWLHEHRGMRRGLATGLIFVGLVVFVVVLVVLLIPLGVELAKQIGSSVPDWVDRLNDFAKDNFGTELIGTGQAQDTSKQVGQGFKDWLENAAGTLFGFAASGIGVVFDLLTVGLFTFYLTANSPKIRRTLAMRMSPGAQRRFMWTYDTAVSQTGGYFYSRLALMIINSTLFFFVMVAVGTPVKFALPLAIFQGFVTEFIPAVGTYIGAAVPIVFVLAELGFTQAVILLIYTIVYQQVENALLSPRISARTMSLNAGVAFGAAIAGGAIAGPIGAFVALPVAGFVTAYLSAYTRTYDIAVAVDNEASGAGEGEHDTAST